MGLFQMSERARKKLTASAGKVLGAGTVRGVFVGKAHARMTTPAAIAIGVFATAFVVAVVNGVVLFPGGIVLLLVISSIRPQRVVALTDDGVALISRSVFTGRPSKVLARLPHTVLTAPGSLAQQGPVALGPDRVTFSRKERERLLRFVAPPAPVGY